MAIVRWKNSDVYDPWETMRRLQDEINNFFDVDHLPAETGLFDRNISPPIDIIEEKGAYKIVCELPGLEKEDVELSVASQVLTIKGQKKVDVGSENQDRKYFRQETRSGTFQRTITLPAAADSEKVKAELRDGLLIIELPKKKEALPKQITVKIQ